MNKGCSLFTQIKHVKIMCIFIIKGRAIRKLMGVGGDEVQKNIFVQGKLNEKYSCTPSNVKNVHTRA